MVESDNEHKQLPNK